MKSENEEVNNVAVLHGAGGLPKKAVCNEAYKMGYGTPRNYEDLQQEEHDALIAEQKAQTQQQKTQQNVVAASRNNQ